MSSEATEPREHAAGDLRRIEAEIERLRAERNSVTYQLEQALTERERLHRHLDSLASVREEAAS